MNLPVWSRSWVRQPGLTGVLLAVIAIGIGATTATFSLVYSLVLRPLPFADPDALVVLQTRSAKLRGAARPVSLPDFEDYRRDVRQVASMAAFIQARFGLLEGGSSRAVEYARVTPEFFGTLGARPYLGRVFLPEEDQPGGNSDVAILGYDLWRDHFGSDPGVVGRVLRTSVTSLTIVGVMPQGFEYPSRVKLWVPIQSLLRVRGLGRQSEREIRRYDVVARLRRGVTPEQAEAELQQLGRNLEKKYPVSNEAMQPIVTPLRKAELGVLATYTWLLFASVSLVLLVCIANVSNLLLVRLAARTKELAVHTALGAGARHLVGGHLAECLGITAAGGLVALGIAWMAVTMLPRVVGSRLPGWVDLDLHAPVLFFALGVTVFTGLVIGILPGVLSSRVDLNDVLKQGSRGSSAAGRVKRGLVVAEVALAALLLVGAGLLLRTLDAIRQVDPGFDAENVVTVQLSPFVPGEERERIRRSTAYFERMSAGLRELPGVVAVGGTDKFPFSDTYVTRQTMVVEAKGDLQSDVVRRAPATAVDVTPDYFAALGIPVLEGRSFRESDDLNAPWVIVLSARASGALFPGRSAIGRQVRINTAGLTDPWATVIGVVGSVKYRATDTDDTFELYYPYKQYGLSTTRLAIRLEGSRSSLEEDIRRVAAAVDPSTPVEDVRSMPELMAETIWQQRLWSGLLAGFAGTALLLAALGLYGLLAFSVGQRTREIGVRLALGSGASRVISLVARESITLVTVGLLIGLGAGVGLARWMNAVLFRVSWLDPWTYMLVTATLLVSAGLAAMLPAFRASRVDPVVALRAE